MRVFPSNLYLKADGTWLHEGTPVEHARLAALLHRSITAGPDGKAVVSTNGQDAGAFDCEDTPLRVLGAFLDGAGIQVTLSNERTELLEPDTIEVHDDGSWTCVNTQGLTARFTRQAQLALMDCVEEAAGGYVLNVAGRTWPLRAA